MGGLAISASGTAAIDLVADDAFLQAGNGQQCERAHDGEYHRDFDQRHAARARLACSERAVYAARESRKCAVPSP